MESSSIFKPVTPKEYAEFYNDKFGCVFPLRNPDTGTAEELKARKKPAVNWELYKIMRPSQKQIDRWFAKKSNYNLAIPTGWITGIIAIDVDGETANNRVKEKLQIASANLRSAFLKTLVNVTGSGTGRHFIFKIQDDSDPNLIEKICGVDIWSNTEEHSEIKLKANGGYIMAPPSRHPNGKLYSWDDGKGRGKEPWPLTRRELLEFIRLVSNNPKRIEMRLFETDDDTVDVGNDITTTASERPTTNDIINYDDNTIDIAADIYDRLFELVEPYYVDGVRDKMIYCLSGYMRKEGKWSFDEAKVFFSMLCTWVKKSKYSDEDIEKSLRIVDYQYDTLKSTVNVKGISGLHELFIERYDGTDAETQKKAINAYMEIRSLIRDAKEKKKQQQPPPPIMVSAGGEGKEELLLEHQQQQQKQQTEEKESVRDKEARMLIVDRLVDDNNTKIIGYLIEQVMNRLNLKVLDDTLDVVYYDEFENIWRYGGGKNGEAIIHSEIEDLGQHAISQSVKNEVFKHIQDMKMIRISRDEFEDINRPSIINLSNCRLDIFRQVQLNQNAEDNLTFTKFPITYDPAAECPAIEKFLSEVILDPYKLKEVLKFAAHVLLSDNRYEKGLMLLGAGGNGKSKVIAVFEAMAGGYKNCSHVSLHEIEEERFARVRLYGKILNTYADNQSGKLKNTGTIKLAMSDDMIEGQEKYKPRFTFRNRAKMIISTNDPPETTDISYAWFRRWLLVAFDRTFVKNTEDPNDPNKADVNLVDKITAPSEMSGWLNLALRYLPVLVKENGFMEQSAEAVKNEYTSLSSNVARYLQECCVIDFGKNDYATRTDFLYSHYAKWCEENQRLKPVTEEVFGSKLAERGIQKKRKRVKKGGMAEATDNRVHFYEKIMLKHVLYATQNESLDDANNKLQEMQDERQKRENENEKTSQIHECIYCALDNQAGNMPLFESPDPLKVQQHIIFKHPGLDFEYIIASPGHPN